MAKYVYDITKDADLKKLNAFFDNLEKIFTSKKFKNFIADKCLDELDSIMANNLSNFGDGEEHSGFISKVEEYKRNHKKEIGNDYILIYNETILTPEEMTWVSEKTKSNYPDGLSISKVIEYGTGLVGSPQDDWEVNVNNHNKSWSYIDSDDKLRHTQGISGKFIYLKLLQTVQKEFENWVIEYVGKNMEE